MGRPVPGWPILLVEAFCVPLDCIRHQRDTRRRSANFGNLHIGVQLIRMGDQMLSSSIAGKNLLIAIGITFAAAMASSAAGAGTMTAAGALPLRADADSLSTTSAA